MTDNLKIAFDRDKRRYLLHLGLNDKGLFIAPIYAVEWPTAEVAQVYYANASKWAPEAKQFILGELERFDFEVDFFDPANPVSTMLFQSKTEGPDGLLYYVASLGEDLTGKLMHPIPLRGRLSEQEIDWLYESLHPGFYYANPLYSKDFDICEL
jgi:hypothetical protein